MKLVNVDAALVLCVKVRFAILRSHVDFRDLNLASKGPSEGSSGGPLFHYCRQNMLRLLVFRELGHFGGLCRLVACCNDFRLISKGEFRESMR